MAAKQQEAQPKDSAPQDRQVLCATIGRNVIQVLGQPGNLHKVQVAQLWGDNYRVNILLGANAASITVAFSYFLQADAAGAILTSTPRITRQY